jgi:predicted ATP-dependent serine protease
MLKADQYHAYDIVTGHLDQTLSGCELPPLRMLIHGEGGTGKSKVIQTIMEYFAH